MNILLIALHYHDYTNQIAAELRRAGHMVSLHDIQPRDLGMKVLRVAAASRWQARLDAHHASILTAERGRAYDVVMFVQVHQMSQANLAAFRQEFREAKFILYNWDSIANHDFRAHAAAFDTVATFDPADARDYGLLHLPLFCVRGFQTLARREQERRGVYFVGNIVSPARYDAVAAFRDYCEAHGIRLQTHLACTPVVQSRLLRAGRLPRGVSLSGIAPARFIDMIETSTTVFDFANHQQTGYTMRVIENLCAGKKIITSNRRIRYEPFYTPDRILIFDGLDFSGVADFLAVPLAQPDEDFADFHLQNFLVRLLEGRGHPLPPAQALPAPLPAPLSAVAA
ncbi:MAG: hypothetical protein H7267_11470 [Sandarakinorhabdus sp.]|nr:hypothetical protein [Sandarakinorhabdus sp.]